MGGIGSGKYSKYKTKPTTGSYYCIDLRKLSKQISLDHRCGFTLEWNNKGEVKSSVDCIFDNNILEIHYSFKGKENQSGIIDYVELTSTPCHFGGERQWFVCPGCGNKSLTLYIVNRFRCRKCHGLYHPSSNEGDLYRATRAMRNIQDKLNGTGFRPIDGVTGLSKPKWMREKTFNRLYKKAHFRKENLSEVYQRIFGFYLE